MQSHESVLHGIVQSGDLGRVLLTLETLSAAHLSRLTFQTCEREFRSTSSRYNIFVKEENTLSMKSILSFRLPDENLLKLLTDDGNKICTMYQEGRTKSGNKIVRSRVQSLVHGNTTEFLNKIGYGMIKKWDFIGVSIDLLAGVTVSIMCPFQEVETITSSSSPSAAPLESYLIEICCPSSDSKVELAHERTAAVAIALAPYVLLPEE